MKKLITTAFMILTTLSGAGFAQPNEIGIPETGNELYEQCTGEALAVIGCTNFITGAMKGADTAVLVMQLAAQASGEDGFPAFFCTPEGVTYRQLRDVIIAYLQNHPEVRHEDPASLVIAALQEIWPCSQ